MDRSLILVLLTGLLFGRMLDCELRSGLHGLD